MTASVVHDAGRFNRYLSFANEVESPDGLGGFARAYEMQGTVWAHLCAVKATVAIAGELGEQVISHKVLVRFRSGIEPGTRFTTGSRNIFCVTVRDPDETGRYLECEVNEK